MDIDTARFGAGLVLLSCAITYAWWVKVRVLRLRDDLFSIRDRLFDAAESAQAFDDPAYRYARNSINSTIRLAGTLSVPTAIYLFIKVDLRGISSRPVSGNESLQASITEALEERDGRVAKYLARETFSGRLFSLIALLYLLPREVRGLFAKQSVGPCLDSPLAHELSINAA